MLDYQIVRVSSPAADLFCLLLNCTDYETRMQYFFDWIDYYYNSLEDALSNHGYKANFVYPKDKLDADLQRYGKNYFAMAVIMSNILVRESEDVVDMTDVSTDLDPEIFAIGSMRTSLKERYQNRVEGLIKSGIELGYL